MALMVRFWARLENETAATGAGAAGKGKDAACLLFDLLHLLRRHLVDGDGVGFSGGELLEVLHVGLGGRLLALVALAPPAPPRAGSETS